MSAKVDPSLEAGCVQIKPPKRLLLGPASIEVLERRVQGSESQNHHFRHFKVTAKGSPTVHREGLSIIHLSTPHPSCRGGGPYIASPTFH